MRHPPTHTRARALLPPCSLSGFLPVLVYLSYMSIMIMGLYFAMGAVGMLSSMLFVHYIMSAVKQD